jgi:DNA-binding transcriptional ArsR family regulator
MTMDVFQAIADPNRRHLLEELRRQPRTVNELPRPADQPTGGLAASQGAARQRLVTVQNQGTSRIYTVRTEGFMHLNLWVDQFWS